MLSTVKRFGKQHELLDFNSEEIQPQKREKVGNENSIFLLFIIKLSDNIVKEGPSTTLKVLIHLGNKLTSQKRTIRCHYMF